MIECENKKPIFTHKKNFAYLIEFAKNFDLRLHYAKTDSEFIISLENVAVCYCDQNYESTSEYQIVQKDILNCKEDRTSITSKAKKIRQNIKKLILKSKKITFKQIQQKFNDENISVSALSNHFAHVRHELANQGIQIVKIKNGIYEIQAPTRTKT